MSILKAESLKDLSNRLTEYVYSAVVGLGCSTPIVLRAWCCVWYQNRFKIGNRNGLPVMLGRGSYFTSGPEETHEEIADVGSWSVSSMLSR
jgi:hypothetical protein